MKHLCFTYVCNIYFIYIKQEKLGFFSIYKKEGRREGGKEGRKEMLGKKTQINTNVIEKQ